VVPPVPEPVVPEPVVVPVVPVVETSEKDHLLIKQLTLTEKLLKWFKIC
jgi:hypothetical protein